MESCGMNVIKYLLFIFNLIFAISGIAIIVAGGITLSDAVDFDTFDESGNFGPAIVLIVIGAIVFIVAFFGCFGAVRESYCMLMTFAVFLLIIFCVELAAGIAAACAKHEITSEKLQQSFEKYSADANGNDKKNWDRLQMAMKCCGVKGPNDWGVNIPDSCCHDAPTDVDTPNQTCQSKSIGKNYIYKNGCYDLLKMSVTNNTKALIGVGIGIAFIELIGIVLACWLAAVIKKENGEEK